MATLDLRSLARERRPEVPELPELTGSAVATWRGRMVNEHGSARVFEALALQMRSASFDAELVDTCAGFAEEERRHGVLCGAVVEALGGEAIAEALDEQPFPLHPDVEPIEGVLRNLLSISCLSETVAVSLIGAERLAMPEGALRELLSTIWADEVGHARFGWAIVSRRVPSLDPAARHRLGVYLQVALAHLERHELAHLPLAACPPAEGAALGLCSGREARALFFDTVSGVILPRLQALGLPAIEAWRRRGQGELRAAGLG
ncbi:MAG: ferritin-like domain-containing protein [Polyangiaceae bacterium]|jgi:hypothetical protein|nr:ferritin-like domain-containing protein [Polyangiaceae bacterium]